MTTPVPADPSNPDLPGEPAAVEFPSPVGQQEASHESDRERREDASRRIKNDPRT